MHTTTHSSTKTTNRGDDNFDELAAAVNRRAKRFKESPLFQTDASDLYAVFIANLDSEHRQSHRCHTCRHFLKQFGALVTVNEDDETESVFWGEGKDVPIEYAAAVRAMKAVVETARITTVFYSSEKRWGTPKTGGRGGRKEWHHFGLPALSVFAHSLNSASQMSAQRLEEREMLGRALEEYPLALVEKAVGLLETDALYRSEKVLGVATWLLELHKKLKGLRRAKRYDAVVWRHVAVAPAGFTHVKSTMIGTLLQDLRDGYSLAAVAKRFAEKMKPTQYMRPQAAPTEGQINAAEKVVGKLESAGALKRRFARTDELKPLWVPKAFRENVRIHGDAGVFSHLRNSLPPSSPLDVISARTMTWEKFAREILPHAAEVKLRVPHHGAFISLVTAANPDAPSILKWDDEEARNPVSWYFYVGGAYAQSFNLPSDGLVRVKMFTNSPAFWGRHQHGESDLIIAILEGARDNQHQRGGGLFPENLKSEYHGIRAVIEKYSNTARIEGRETADGFGLAMQKNAPTQFLLRVLHDKGVSADYRIDRLD